MPRQTSVHYEVITGMPQNFRQMKINQFKPLAHDFTNITSTRGLSFTEQCRDSFLLNAKTVDVGYLTGHLNLQQPWFQRRKKYRFFAVWWIIYSCFLAIFKDNNSL